MNIDSEELRAALLAAEAAIGTAISKMDLLADADLAAIKDLEWAEYVVLGRRKALEAGKWTGRTVRVREVQPDKRLLEQE